MPPVSGIGNPPPVQPPHGGEHGGHTAVPNTGSGQSFSTALAQAMDQPPGESEHGGHATASGGAGGHTMPLSAPSSGAHPQHFQIGESSHGGQHSLQEVVLGVRAYRQQLIASNIANADTPGYKAIDIDFQEALRVARSIANTPPLTLSTTASGHITGQAQFTAPPYPIKYHTPSQASVDGNTVEMDVERSKFAENSMMWEFARDRVSSHYKHMMEMLQNLKD
jgi:flagellar basal-body rod protein FlgB